MTEGIGRIRHSLQGKSHHRHRHLGGTFHSHSAGGPFHWNLIPPVSTQLEKITTHRALTLTPLDLLVTLLCKWSAGQMSKHCREATRADRRRLGEVHMPLQGQGLKTGAGEHRCIVGELDDNRGSREFFYPPLQNQVPVEGGPREVVVVRRALQAGSARTQGRTG